MSSNWIQVGNSFGQNLGEALSSVILHFNCGNQLRVLNTEGECGIRWGKGVKVTVTSGQGTKPNEQQNSHRWAFVHCVVVVIQVSQSLAPSLPSVQYTDHGFRVPAPVALSSRCTFYFSTLSSLKAVPGVALEANAHTQTPFILGACVASLLQVLGADGRLML